MRPVAGSPEREEDRHQVLVGRMVVGRERRLAPPVEQRFRIALGEFFGEPVGEGVEALPDLRIDY